MKRKLSLLLAVIFTLSVFFVACGEKTEEPAPAETEEKVMEEGQQENKTEKTESDKTVPNPAKDRANADNTLIVGTNETKGDFLPVYYSTTYDGYIISLVWNGMFTNNKEGELVPSLAKSWELSEDKKTYTFSLRDDVKFSDGTAFTADDVVFTYTAMCDPSYDGRYFSEVMELAGYDEYKDGDATEVSGIKKLDDYTVSFTFKEAQAANIYKLGLGIMPKAHYDFEKGDTQSLKDKMNAQDMVGTGPYVFKKYEPKQFVEFTANPDYFNGAPKIENLIVKFTTVETQIQELQAGTIDVQTSVPPNGENAELIKQPGFLDTVQYPSNSYGYMGFNLRDERLADKNVRQALTYGFNRQAFIDIYYQGYANVCNGPISQVSWAYNNDINKYEYDLEKANTLLDEAGWTLNADGVREKDGKTLEFTWDTYTDSKYVETLIPMLKADWEKIGVKVEPNLMDFGALVEKIYTKREFEMYNMAWSMSVDPGDSRSTFHSEGDVPDGNNSIGFRNEESDKLLEDGSKEFDKEKRKEIYSTWAKLVNEELPYMFLSQNMTWDIVNNRIANFETSPYCDWTYEVHNYEIEK